MSWGAVSGGWCRGCGVMVVGNVLTRALADRDNSGLVRDGAGSFSELGARAIEVGASRS